MNTAFIARLSTPAAAALLTVSTQAATYSVSPNQAIPDGSIAGVTSTLTATGLGTDLVSDLSVSVGLTHSWVGDLVLQLTHGATTVTLMHRPGVPNTTFGFSTDLSSLYPLLFSMAATTPAEEVGAGCSGTNTVGASLSCLNTHFLPSQPLTAFVGAPAGGIGISNAPERPDDRAANHRDGTSAAARSWQRCPFGPPRHAAGGSSGLDRQPRSQG